MRKTQPKPTVDRPTLTLSQHTVRPLTPEQLALVTGGNLLPYSTGSRFC